jgi:hypothetical protein
MFSDWQSTGEVSLDAKFEEPPPVQEDVIFDLAKRYFDGLISFFGTSESLSALYENPMTAVTPTLHNEWVM